jgi:hypothetical protein
MREERIITGVVAHDVVQPPGAGGIAIRELPHGFYIGICSLATILKSQ